MWVFAGWGCVVVAKCSLQDQVCPNWYKSFSVDLFQIKCTVRLIPNLAETPPTTPLHTEHRHPTQNLIYHFRLLKEWSIWRKLLWITIKLWKYSHLHLRYFQCSWFSTVYEEKGKLICNFIFLRELELIPTLKCKLL